MKRREFITLLGAATAGWPLVARAQATVPVIGFLSAGSSESFAKQLHAFRQALASVGYFEGRNLTIEYGWADGDYDRLPELTAALVHRGAAVIATSGGVLPVLAARQAATTTPIVFVMGADPIRAGLIKNLSRPDGNVTGITSLNMEVGAKRLELLRELVPRATSVALLSNPASALAEVGIKDMQLAASALKFDFHVLSASADQELEPAFETARRLGLSGIAVGTDAFFISRSKRLAILGLEYAMPTIFQFREFVAAGGLMSYGSAVTETYRLLGGYVVRILMGEKPSELPAQQATKVEFLINLKTAKALGLDVPPSLLARADEVTE